MAITRLPKNHQPTEELSAYIRVESDDEVILADTLTEVISVIIDGYASEDVEEAFDQRTDLLAGLLDQHQAVICAVLTEEGRFDSAEESEATLTTLFRSRNHPADVDEWEHEVPLLQLATHYAPYTTTPKPIGNITFYSTYTEREFLDALKELGELDFTLAAA